MPSLRPWGRGDMDHRGLAHSNGFAVQQPARNSRKALQGLKKSILTEAEGLEPPCACARRISSAVPYQLGLRLQPLLPLVGAPGFEPGTSASRTQRSTKLSHAPYTRTEWDSNPRGLSPTRFPIVRLKPLGHPSFTHPSTSRGGRPTEGVGFEPTWAL